MPEKLAIKEFYNSKERYEGWKGKNLTGLNKGTSELLKRFLYEMKEGMNVAGKKGGRSYKRLNALKCRLPTIARWMEKEYNKPLTNINGEEAVLLFNKLIKGEIKKANGEAYKSVKDYVRDFHSFWRWYMKHARRKENRQVEDVMTDVSEGKRNNPEFCYISEGDFKRLALAANFKYRVLLTFLFDAGCRPPSEAFNIRVSDVEEIKDKNIANLTIKDEISKTFGRKFKLMLCWPLLKEYISQNKLKKDDCLFSMNPINANRYVRRLGFKVLGIGEKTMRSKGKAGATPDVKGGISLYDFRHASACYWLPRYKNESALKYRFGWRSSRMIEYYSRFLGMKDSISEDDLIDTDMKTQLEKQLAGVQRDNAVLEERFSNLQEQVAALLVQKVKERKGGVHGDS